MQKLIQPQTTIKSTVRDATAQISEAEQLQKALTTHEQRKPINRLFALQVLRREMTIKAERIRSSYKNRSQNVVDQVQGSVDMLFDLHLIDSELAALCMAWIRAEYSARQYKGCSNEHWAKRYEAPAEAAFLAFDTYMIELEGKTP